MKRKPIKRERVTPPAEYEIACIRSGGTYINGECIGGHCQDCRSTKDLQFSHTKHRKMGGTTSKEIHNARNIKRRCQDCHNKLDKRSMPKMQSVVKTACMFTKEQQTGIKSDKQTLL